MSETSNLLPTTLLRPGIPLALRLVSVGWVDLPAGGWNLRGAVNGFWTVYCNDAAGAELRCAGRTHAMAAGAGWLIPPQTVYDADTRRRVRHLFLYVDVPGWPDPLLAPPALRGPLAVPPAASTALLALARSPAARLDLRAQAQVLAAVGGAFAAVLERLDPATVEGAEGQGGLAPALALVAEGYGRPLANRDLARACGLGVHTFVRRFRAVLGATPAQYVRRHRCRIAMQHLVATGWSLDRIAAATGFGSRAFFSRVFAQVTGMGPSAYRRGHWGPADT